MKLHIEKVHVVDDKNIFGQEIEGKDYYHIYVWKWFRKMYIELYVIYDDYQVVLNPMDDHNVRCVRCDFSRTRKNTKGWSKEEAEFFVKDINDNPNKYRLLSN